MLSTILQNLLHSIGNVFRFGRLQSFPSGFVIGSIWSEAYTGIKSFIYKKGGEGGRRGRVIIIGELYYRHPLGPVVLCIIAEGSQSPLNVLVRSFRLSVSLGIVGGREVRLNAKSLAHTFLEGGHELWASV